MRAIAFAVLVVVVSPRVARAEGEMTAVVRVSGATGERLLARIEGQTSDLDVALIVERGAALEASLSAQLTTARELAAERDARVVIWFKVVEDRETIVYVAEPAADRVLVRRIGHDRAGEPALASSAVAEAAALVVRSSLRALAAGGEIGVAAPEAIADDDDDGSDRDDDDDDDDDEPLTPPVRVAAGDDDGGRELRGAARRPLRAFAGLGWRAVLDGDSELGHHGAAAFIGVARGRWRVAAAGGFSPPVARDDELTTIEVGRMQAELAVGAVVHAGAQTRVVAELAAGVVRFSRSTTVRDPDVTATPASAISGPIVSPAVRVQRRLGAGGPIWVELVLGAEILGRAPEFGYELDGMYVARSSLWVFEPRAGLGLIVESF